MKMNKYFARFALVTLLAPTLLAAQQAVAEELPTSETTEETAATTANTDSSTVESSSVTEVTEVTETTETTEVTGESTDSSTSETAETSESTTENSSTTATETSTSSETKKAVKAVTASMTVNFVAEGSGTAVGSGTISGEVGTLGNTAVPAGYGISGISAPGFFGEEVAGQIFVFGTITDSAAPVTVTVYPLQTGAEVLINLIDEEGNTVIGGAISSLGGNIGEAFSYTAPEVPGYRIVDNPTITGVFSAELQEFNIRYERVTTTLTVICLDTAGNNLMDANQVFEGKFGEYGILEPALFPGMELISVNGSPLVGPIEVVFTDQDQVMTLVYQETTAIDPIEPVTPTPAQVTPPAPTTAVPLNAPVAPAAAPNKAAELPKTGEETASMAISMLGMTLIAGVYFTKKKKENEFTL